MNEDLEYSRQVQHDQFNNSEHQISKTKKRYKWSTLCSSSENQWRLILATFTVCNSCDESRCEATTQIIAIHAQYELVLTQTRNKPRFVFNPDRTNRNGSWRTNLTLTQKSYISDITYWDEVDVEIDVVNLGSDGRQRRTLWSTYLLCHVGTWKASRGFRVCMKALALSLKLSAPSSVNWLQRLTAW